MSYIKLIECPHCNIVLDGSFNVPNHIRWCVKNPANIKFNSPVIRNCVKCNSEFSVDYKSKVYTCSLECRHKHTEESKKLLSTKRSQYLSDNKDKHPWKRSDKFVSVPCEKFKEYLTDNAYEFIEEFSPIPDRHFSIDIAFPHLKIGIEINGNQHYDKFGNLKEYYQARHDLIESHGWHLIEVHYSKCFNIEKIKEVVDFAFV